MRRRDFLQKTSALGAASLLGHAGSARAEPPPEVKKIRLVHFPAVCLAPGYLAEELLHAEGFEEVEYVKLEVTSQAQTIATGRADFWVDSAPSLVNLLANHETVVALGGLHAGCFELLAKKEVRKISELKGRSVSISAFGATEHILVASMAAYVGLDPRRDIDWKVMHTADATMQAFADGKVDAFLGFAPQPQLLRVRGIGNVILSTTHDRPWSQYFCCMNVGNREFISRNPVATKRALRAFLKAADICATDPARAARFMADKGYAPYEVALEVLGELPYRRWRDASPEDTIRFHALRLHEAGIISMSPHKLIERGTDWRFFNELKKELKA